MRFGLFLLAIGGLVCLQAEQFPGSEGENLLGPKDGAAGCRGRPSRGGGDWLYSQLSESDQSMGRAFAA